MRRKVVRRLEARREVVSMTQRGRLEPQDKMGGEEASPRTSMEDLF